MSAHVIKSGKCIHCGCDKNAIEYFGWSCSGRAIQHSFKNGVCLNCGFLREVVEHFDWPCRLENRGIEDDEELHEESDKYNWSRTRQNRPFEERYKAWQYPNDEIRYGRLLGLRGKVTRWDIKCAYREQAALYHPDKVAHMGTALQEMANEKMKEINIAFSYFQRKYGL